MEEQIDKDIGFIKSVGEISISKTCKKIKVDKYNLYHKKASADKIHQVAEDLRKQLSDILAK